MTLDLNKIYGLLPAIYRSRDVEIARKSGGLLDAPETTELQQLLSIQGNLTAVQERRLEELQDKQTRGPLRALIAVIAEQMEVLEESLLQGYDDQFIETCREWVVPYIGDLVGARRVFVFPGANFSLRAEVADTITNRSRKGTVSALERLAHDLTGWDAKVVEYFSLLATTQYMKHVRPGNLAIAPIRDADQQMLNTPFDAYARTADVRRIETRGGKYNIPNIGIFVWRIPSQPMEDSPGFKVDALRYKFDAIGRDVQLYTNPVTLNQATQRANPLNVAMPISRRTMNRNLEAYYGAGKSILVEYTLGSTPPEPLSVTVCNLSDVTDGLGNVIGWAHQPQDAIAIDPELGRIAFPSNVAPPDVVHVSYYYGFSAQIGGGQYERDLDSGQQVTIHVPSDFPTIQAALDSAVSQLAPPVAVSAVVEIQNNEYYAETPSIVIPAGTSVALRAADGKRPVLVLPADFAVSGGAAAAFHLDGLLVSGGSISVPDIDGSGNPNELGQLQLSHCTLEPGPTPQIDGVAPQLAGPRLSIKATDVAVSINDCILGSIRVDDTCTVNINGSIIDALSATEVAYSGHDSTSAGGTLTVEDSTIIGKLHSRRIDLASNTIFVAQVAPLDVWLDPVIADQLQLGCVRFSYVPPGSQVPRRYRCHPAPDDGRPVSPAFTSLRCGDPGYCQLASQSGPEILRGADDQSEMGVFHDLYQPQRESNLQGSLQEYLRFGLDAGIFHAS